MSAPPACARVLALAVTLLALGACGSGGLTQTAGVDTFAPAPRVLDYLRAAPFPKLVLEIDAVPGFEPRAAAQAAVTARLGELLDKPGGVTATLDGTITSRGGDHAWTFAELDALADQVRDLALDGQTARMHVLFLDGRYDSGPGGGTVLGLAWDQRTIAIFKQTIESSCATTILPEIFRDQLCTDAETAIWLHEVGHVIGLVDAGLPMVTNHEDPAHPGHDVDPDCLMYWAYEGDALVDRLASDLVGGGRALDFDAACLADIAAVRDAP